MQGYTTVLPHTLHYMYLVFARDHNALGKISHVIDVWAQRQVFPVDFINILRESLKPNAGVAEVRTHHTNSLLPPPSRPSPAPQTSLPISLPISAPLTGASQLDMMAAEPLTPPGSPRKSENVGDLLKEVSSFESKRSSLEQQVNSRVPALLSDLLGGDAEQVDAAKIKASYSDQNTSSLTGAITMLDDIESLSSLISKEVKSREATIDALAQALTNQENDMAKLLGVQDRVGKWMAMVPVVRDGLKFLLSERHVNMDQFTVPSPSLVDTTTAPPSSMTIPIPSPPVSLMDIPSSLPLPPSSLPPLGMPPAALPGMPPSKLPLGMAPPIGVGVHDVLRNMQGSGLDSLLQKFIPDPFDRDRDEDDLKRRRVED